MNIYQWWTVNMSVHLRYAEITDLTYLMDIDLKSYPIAWESEIWRSSIHSYHSESCVCITSFGTPIAFAVFQRDGNQLKVLRIAVGVPHRRKQFGSMLMDWLDKYAADRKISRISCLVCEANLTGCKFLSKNGYRVPAKGGIMPNAFTDYGESLNGYYFLKTFETESVT
jgi:ribosomal protein S18 acetylase RimI-like enzyme